MEAALLGAGMEAEIFTVEGPAGIFAVYPNKGVNLGLTFLTEFVVVSYVLSCMVLIRGSHILMRVVQDFLVGVIIWGVLDPANIFVVNSTIPVIIGLSEYILQFHDGEYSGL